MLTTQDALRAYAAMMNTLDVFKLELVLSDNFRYASQWVFSEIDSKSAYLDYMALKLQTVRANANHVWAEMAWLDYEVPEPCVVLSQGEKDNRIALVLAEVENGQVKRLDMCCAPSPHSARRTGEFPD